ncbi:MAG: response regulator transcription factor [Planctomycetota bacterium]
MKADLQRQRTEAARDDASRKAAPAATARLLVVEDDPLSAQIFERALARGGYVVDTARDALQALRRSEARAPSAVVLDLTLPVGSGADVVRALRARGDDVPVLIVSGKQPWQSALTAAELAPGRWLTKPVKPRDLLDAVHALLARR